ncbi:MAG: M50 family metallopeptidase [Thalassotalea sp.]
MASSSFLQRYKFWILLLLAIILTRLPVVSIPFNWLESFFHELSHGIAALITGGKIIKIELFTNGAGLCTTQGGSRLLISFMGYAGAIFWGALIYLAATSHLKMAKNLSVLMLLLLAISIVFWVRDLLTLMILLMLMVLFYGKWRLKSEYIGLMFQFTGITVLLNAVLSPLHLLDGRHLGDGATLATITYIPELIWVVLWSSMGVGVLYQLGKRT